MIMLASYQIDFEVEGSIFIVNKGQLHFLYKKSYNQMMCFILIHFFIDISGYEFCATCLLELCDLM